MKATTRINLWDFGSRTFKSAAPIQVLRDVAPEPDPTVGQPRVHPPGVTLQDNFSTLTVGSTVAGFTNRWASVAGTWTVVADATAPGGKVVRCNRGTAAARRVLSWNVADALSDHPHVQVCAQWKATTPASARIGARLTGDTAATAGGYVGGAASDTTVGLTKYLNGSASNVPNPQVTQTITPGTWYVTVVDIIEEPASIGVAATTAIRHKTWPLSSPEPTSWSASDSYLTPVDAAGNDAAPPPGWIGLFAFDAGTSTDFAFLSVGTGTLNAPRPAAAAAPTNQAPVASITSESVATGSTVTVTVTGSDSDGVVTGGALTMTSKPTGSTAVLSGSYPTFTFIADVSGAYNLSATVTDNGTPPLTSVADTATITASATVVTGSRGPNGQHWPPNTPQPWAVATRTCADLHDLNRVLAQCVSGDVVEVTGTSSRNTAAASIKLEGGSTAWPTNVLVRSANLFHTIYGEWSLRSNHTVMSGFQVGTPADKSGHELNMGYCTRAALARTRYYSKAQWLFTGPKRCGLYECVIPDYSSGGDYLRLNTSSTGITAEDFTISGCYFKGKWTVIGSGDHSDTFQIYSPSAPTVRTKVIDTVLFTSGDKMFQTEDGHTKDLHWINCWINAPGDHVTETPPSGTKASSYENAFSGVGDRFLFDRTTVIGAVNHKNAGTSVTANTGTFRDSRIRSGNALTQNNPTKIRTVTGGANVNLTNDPPPALANLLTIWAKPA